VFAGLLFESRTSIRILVLRVRKEQDGEDVAITVDDAAERVDRASEASVDRSRITGTNQARAKP
jgi:hypothetical protein